MDIEGKRLRHRQISEARELLGNYKRHVLAAILVGLEVTSLVLDLNGKSNWVCILAAFLFSLLGFSITIYICIIERTIAVPRLEAEKQLQVVEIVFSLVQLVGTFIHLVLASVGIEENYSSVSLFPLAFTVIMVVFVIKKDRDVIKKNNFELVGSYDSKPIPHDGKSSMDVVDWRKRMFPGSRQRIINLITERLKKLHPRFGPKVRDDLEKTASRIEGDIYSSASSKSDYSGQIAMELLSLRFKYVLSRREAHSLPFSNVNKGNKPPDSALHIFFSLNGSQNSMY